MGGAAAERGGATWIQGTRPSGLPRDASDPNLNLKIPGFQTDKEVKFLKIMWHKQNPSPARFSL